MTDIRRTCFELRHGCASYIPGHLMHPIHARLLGERPWGWRDGMVSSVAGGDVEVEYVTEDGRAALWHHVDLGRTLDAGALVRVHEELHALGGPFGWLNVAVVDGVGRVPTPDDTSVWAPERRIAVTDLATGRAIAVDHFDGGDR